MPVNVNQLYESVENRKVSPHYVDAFRLLKKVCQELLPHNPDMYLTQVSEEDRKVFTGKMDGQQFLREFDLLSPYEQANKLSIILKDEELSGTHGLPLALTLLPGVELANVGLRLRSIAVESRSELAVEAINRLASLLDEKEAQHLVENIPMRDILWEPYSSQVAKVYLNNLVDHEHSLLGQNALNHLTYMPPLRDLQEGNLDLASKLSLFTEKAEEFLKRQPGFTHSVLPCLGYWSGAKEYWNESLWNKEDFFSPEIPSGTLLSLEFASSYKSIAHQVILDTVVRAMEENQHTDRLLNTLPLIMRELKKDPAISITFERWAEKNKEELKNKSLYPEQWKESPAPKFKK